MCLAGLVWADGCTKDTRIVLIFAYVAFLGVSYMTYCSERRYRRTAVRARVKTCYLIIKVIISYIPARKGRWSTKLTIVPLITENDGWFR